MAGLLAIASVGAVVSAQFSSTVNEGLTGVFLSPPAQAAVAHADEQPLSGASVEGVPARQRAVVARAIDDASVHAFRAGMLVSGALVIAGGVISFIGVRNPRRRVSAEECPGGAVCGASEDLARTYPAPAPRERVAAEGAGA